MKGKNIFFMLVVVFMCQTMRATVFVINAEDFKFIPPNVTVAVGDTITWIWDDAGSDHTTTSTSVPSGAAVWDNLLDATHTSFSYVITQPGTYHYKCTFHELMNMTGVFIAIGEPLAIENAADGVALQITIADAHEMHITYSINDPALVNISILDLQGRLVDALPTEIHTPGTYTKTYNASDIPKGIYIVQLQAENTYLTKKINLE